MYCIIMMIIVYFITITFLLVGRCSASRACVSMHVCVSLCGFPSGINPQNWNDADKNSVAPAQT